MYYGPVGGGGGAAAAAFTKFPHPEIGNQSRLKSNRF
jgi:hypothetical protein